MNDPYLYENSNVLKNVLNIKDEKALDVAEAELFCANMIISDANAFKDFFHRKSSIHKTMFM